MRLPFLKMHGTGNRILVVDNRQAAQPPPHALQLRELGDESTGPGFDQLMWLEKSASEKLIASYRVFNADGSEVEQCGNGLRCLAWALSREGQREFSLGSPAGVVSARVDSMESVSVSMGLPEFEPVNVPFVADERRPAYDIDVLGQTMTASVLSMGNPHCVLRVEDVDAAPVETLGPALESHPRFPDKTNVGFMAVRDASHIDLRVFERGVGETAACGTGACAAVVAGIESGDLSGDVRVTVPGGELVVSWQPETVWLTGRVELINEGSIDL